MLEEIEVLQNFLRFGHPFVGLSCWYMYVPRPTNGHINNFVCLDADCGHVRDFLGTNALPSASEKYCIVTHNSTLCVSSAGPQGLHTKAGPLTFAAEIIDSTRST
jgi:hypothetical protein